jgi:hypothetical protein
VLIKLRVSHWFEIVCQGGEGVAQRFSLRLTDKLRRNGEITETAGQKQEAFLNV